MTTNYQPKSAIVTGATRGIGFAIAEKYRSEGYDLTCVGSKPGGSGPVGTRYISADFTKESDVDSLCNELALIKPDVLINCAGINVIGPFADIDSQDFQHIQLVNVQAPFELCKACVPSMKSAGWGRIVNIGSVWGKIGKELRASYSTSKYAVEGMTAALAAEVAEFGILANTVSPGIIETEMTRSVLTEDQIDNLIQTVPARRLGQPEEVAELVYWLGSPNNTFVSGQNIAIDGGLLRV